LNAFQNNERVPLYSKKNIEALIELSNMLSDGNGGYGNLCFLSCKAGSGGMPQALQSFLFDKNGVGDFNIYINSNSSRYNKGSEQYTMMPVFGAPISTTSPHPPYRATNKPMWYRVRKGDITQLNFDIVINKSGGAPIRRN